MISDLFRPHLLPLLLLAVIAVGQKPSSNIQQLYRSFRDPAHSNSLMPYWYWNGRITPADTRRQIQAMIEQGVYQAIVFPWDGMDVRYLSEDYWQQFGAAVKIAREQNFTLNFADEYDWPSGHAWDNKGDKPELSRVLIDHPEYRMVRLQYTEAIVDGNAWHFKLPAGSLFTVAGQLDNAGRVDYGSLRLISADWSPRSGKWLAMSWQLVPATGGHNTRVDLLNPDAVDHYLDLVYGEYAKRFGQYFGNTIKLSVADHEGAYGSPIAFTPRLWQVFQQRHGYDLRPMLPLLVYDASEGRRAQQVRKDYLDTISHLYVTSFTGKVAEWCRRHNLQHATSLYEEQMYIQVGQAGDMFRHWRAGSVVEIDALLERSRMPVDFKEAVSVAHFDRKPLVVENQGLQGHSTFFSLQKARLGTNMCLLWGANTLVPYFDYDPKKTTWPPQWFLGQPFWRYFRHYAEYVNRAQFMNGQGSHIAPVAIYYPLETAFANSSQLFTKKPHKDLLWNSFTDQTENFYTALRLELARKGWDYHILDAEYLRRSVIVQNQLQLADENFRVLILPPMTDIAPESANKMRAFVNAGGTVLAIGRQPEALAGIAIRRFTAGNHPAFTNHLDYLEQMQVPEPIRSDLAPLLAALGSVQTPEVRLLAGDPAHTFFSHRRKGGIDWYWVVNDSDQDSKVGIELPAAGAYERWDAETGERIPVISEGRQMELHLAPWDAFFLVRTGITPTKTQTPDPQWHTLTTLSNEHWKFTPESPVIRVPYADKGTEHIWLAPERNANRNWWLIGPFPFDDHQGFYKTWAPEGEFRADASYEGAFGSVNWKWYESPSPSVTLRTALGLPGSKALGIYYAYVNVFSKTNRTANLRAAFADSMAASWNGDEVLRVHRHPKWLLLRDVWAESAKVRIRAGWNTLLLKLGPSLMVPTGFLLRLADDNGRTIDDVIWSKDKSSEQPSVVDRDKATSVTVQVPPGALVESASITLTTVPEQAVEFRAGTVDMPLQSWTSSNLAFYSGSAIYEKDFSLSQSDVTKKLAVDLGEVGVAAELWVNDVKIGERVWKPFRFDITGRTVAGRNRLKIRIANSDAGWQSQGETIYPKGSWGLPYQTERDRLVTIRPNGLEGPVRILTQVR